MIDIASQSEKAGREEIAMLGFPKIPPFTPGRKATIVQVHHSCDAGKPGHKLAEKDWDVVIVSVNGEHGYTKLRIDKGRATQLGLHVDKTVEVALEPDGTAWLDADRGMHTKC